MNLIKTSHLEKGDCIGIVSPSSSIKNFPRRLGRGIKLLKKLGFKVILGHNAGTPQERAKDINTFFENKKIRAIICTTGGYNSNAILPLLNYSLIRKNPKIFCGFSDITALNLAIYKKAGLITFNGPTVLSTFGEFVEPEFSIRWFKKVLCESKPIGRLEHPERYTDEFLLWEEKDNRERKTKIAHKPKFLMHKNISGKLVGGNLSTLCLLGGTEFFPNFKGTILFLEEDEGSTAEIESKLDYLEQLGVFKQIKGLIFGRPSRLYINSSRRTLYDILRDFGKKYKISIVTDIDCGHTSPMITFPIGIRAYIDGNKEEIHFLSSAVS